MFNRSKIKKEVRKNLKVNYWHKVFVCLLMMLLVGSYSGTKNALNNGKTILQHYFPFISNYYNIDIPKVTNLSEETNTTNGVFKYIFDNTSNIVAGTQIYLKNTEVKGTKFK